MSTRNAPPDPLGHKRAAIVSAQRAAIAKAKEASKKSSDGVWLCNCLTCGVQFASAIRTKSTCSKSCKNKYRRTKTPWRSGPATAKCVVCGQEFSASGTRKTCSEQCKLARERTNREAAWKRALERQKEDRPKRKCIICGTEFRRRSGRQVTCGAPDCNREHMRKYYYEWNNCDRAAKRLGLSRIAYVAMKMIDRAQSHPQESV